MSLYIDKIAENLLNFQSHILGIQLNHYTNTGTDYIIF